VEIVPYSAGDREAVERMNAKLSAEGSEWTFPAAEAPDGAPQLPVWTESFVAREGTEVFGGYLFKHQRFFLKGRELEVGNLTLPLSLGDIDNSYAHVSVALLFDVRQRSPYCYALGLGAEDTKMANLLTAAGWQHLSVPFRFSVKSANPFARNIVLPAEKRLLQNGLRVLGGLRLAGLALGFRELLRSRGRAAKSAVRDGASAREIPEFESFADDLFAAHSASYSLIGDRGAAALNILFPKPEQKYLRLVVERGERIIGWAVVLDTRMEDDKYFGNMRVGTLVDCFAAPQDVRTVVSVVDAVLTRRGVDLVVSNQLHATWNEALAASGYEEGPSNFFLYFSGDLAEQLGGILDWSRDAHMNRGDGEGPGNL
jgi:hypothetical protein